MAEKTKAAGLAPKAAHNVTGSHPTTFTAQLNALIVGAACWRIIPPSFATWLIRRLGLVHE